MISYGATLVGCLNAEALVTAEMVGMEPMVNAVVEPGLTVLQIPLTGLQTLRMTCALVRVSKGRAAVATAGTAIVRLMCEESVTNTVRLLFSEYPAEVAMPTCVLTLESGLLMNPVPVSVSV
jgi:hypothetical protein